jgi:hypothetical protein
VQLSASEQEGYGEEMKIIGRILSRGNIAGLFIPIQSGLERGLYEVRECFGELNLKYLGESAMSNPRIDALDLEGLFAERATSCLTKSEYQDVCRNPKTV